MVHSKFVTDTEIRRQINLGLADVYDKLVQARGDHYFRVELPATTVALDPLVGLPVTFYKLLGIDVAVGGRNFQAEPMTWHRRNDFQFQVGWATGAPVFYEPEGANLRFWPTPGAAHPLTIWYVPYFVDLENEEDLFDGVNGFEEYAVLSAAIWCVNKQDGDPTALLLERNRIEKRIQRMSKTRDQGNATRPRNVRRSHRTDRDLVDLRYWR